MMEQEEKIKTKYLNYGSESDSVPFNCLYQYSLNRRIRKSTKKSFCIMKKANNFNYFDED